VSKAAADVTDECMCEVEYVRDEGVQKLARHHHYPRSRLCHRLSSCAAGPAARQRWSTSQARYRSGVQIVRRMAAWWCVATQRPGSIRVLSAHGPRTEMSSMADRRIV